MAYVKGSRDRPSSPQSTGSDGTLPRKIPSVQTHDLYWFPKSAGSTTGLARFLDEHPPSRTKHIEAESYVYVSRCGDSSLGEKAKFAREAALTKCHQALQALKEACDTIDANDRVPLRASKSKGKSKSQRKRTLIEELGDQTIPQLAKEGGLSGGKWLFFKKPDFVDSTFKTLAYSLIDGPLSKTTLSTVTGVKAACCDTIRDGEEHMVALYFDDVWSKDAAREVAEIVIRHHSQFSRGCKADIYTLLGIDSKHWSGIPSSLYRIDSLIPADVQADLREAYQEAQAAHDDNRHGQQRRTANAADKESHRSKVLRLQEGGEMQESGVIGITGPSQSSESEVYDGEREKKSNFEETDGSIKGLRVKQAPSTHKNDSDTESEQELDFVTHKEGSKKRSALESLSAKVPHGAFAKEETTLQRVQPKMSVPSSFGSAHPKSAADMSKAWKIRVRGQQL